MGVSLTALHYWLAKGFMCFGFIFICLLGGLIYIHRVLCFLNSGFSV